MTVCDIDFRVGGAWRFVQVDDAGNEAAFSGIYQEIDAPSRVVQTETFEPMPDRGYVVTMTLDEADGRTTLTSRLVYKNQEDRDGHLQSGMEWGMNETYD